MENAFKVTGLNKSYPDFSLRNINLSLPKGYITGFIGANGAGKTTFIKCLLGMAKNYGGQVEIFGKPFNALTAADKEKIGVVMDMTPFASVMTAKDIQKVLSNIYKNWDNSRFNSLMTQFKLPYDKAIKDFSTGMRAKLNIATALSHGAEILILDEPTSGLDPIVRDEILDILLEFVGNENHSVFISSHITSDLEKICDYITFIKNGEIVFTEEKDILSEKYTLVHCTKEDLKDIPSDAIIGVRSNAVATSALVFTDRLKGEYVTEKPSIEDIMLYYSKEAK